LVERDARTAPREFVIEGWIPAGCVTTLYGDGGLGKSYIALAIASRIAWGLSWNGLRVVRKKVLYIDGELNAEEVIRRAYRVARGMGPHTGLLQMAYLSLDGRSAADPAVQAEIRKLVETQHFDFIVLDSLTMATYYGGMLRKHRT
jgi:RecA-family ATPase